ncbi:hypothetical protein Micbo1qcDRAFT_216529 [Microdochium bolleyi]|uniref:Zn(2)-C6 fungal-type domain-containing protein n=1 Tax=Microdochium bolleyi TaxID=196109 RepID=A0A136JCS3_9PEZI|nr:hypothetical protein Micbo1qcDRAFT_216529 [Microdochium bolleyi]
MAPASDTERRPKRPVACDRCRTHKLRCERSGPTTRPKASSTLETCVRCTRASASCTTSPPQRVGRPPRQLDGWMSVISVDHGPAAVPSPPEALSESLMADLSCWSEPQMHQMDGLEDLYTGETGPSSPSAGSLSTNITSPRAESDSFAYMDQCSGDNKEAQVESSGFENLLDQQMMHWQTREQLHSRDELGEMFLAFNGATGRDHIDWSGNAGDKSSNNSTIPLGVDQPSTSTILSRSTSSSNREPQPLPTTVQPQCIMTQHSSMSEMSTKSSGQEQSIRDLSVLISKLSQALEDVQDGRAPAFGVALRCADDFLEVVDALAGPILTPKESVMDKVENRTLDASQSLLLLNCYIKIVAIFRAGYHCYGAHASPGASLYSPPQSDHSKTGSAQLGTAELPTTASSQCAALLPFRNPGLQLSTIMHMTLHVLSRAEDVLKSGTQNTAVGPLVQATMRLEDLEGNISALLHDMRGVRKVFGIL